MKTTIRLNTPFKKSWSTGLLQPVIVAFFGAWLSACVTTRPELAESKRAEKEAEETAAVATPAQAKSALDVEELKALVGKLQGRLEELEQQNTKNSALENQLKTLETKLAEMETQVKAEREKKSSPQALLLEAKKASAEKRCGDAVTLADQAFAGLSGDDVETALWLRGDCLSDLKETKRAIIDYGTLIEKFKSSPQIGRAYLRLGQAFETLGQREEARSFYLECAGLATIKNSVESKTCAKRSKKQ